MTVSCEAEKELRGRPAERVVGEADRCQRWRVGREQRAERADRSVARLAESIKAEPSELVLGEVEQLERGVTDERADNLCSGAAEGEAAGRHALREPPVSSTSGA